jgi:transformation/transcription domain-associated protein
VKLEPAFLAGLRCVQPAIRAKFFEVFDASMKRRLHDRLMYITCSQNWEAMGPHYWIKQCIELLVVTASSSKTLCYAVEKYSLVPGTVMMLQFLNISDCTSSSNSDVYYVIIRKIVTLFSRYEGK